MMNQMTKLRIPRPFAAASGLLRQVLLPLIPSLVVSLLLSTSVRAGESASAGASQCAGEEESEDYLVYVTDLGHHRI